MGLEDLAGEQSAPVPRGEPSRLPQGPEEPEGRKGLCSSWLRCPEELRLDQGGAQPADLVAWPRSPTRSPGQEKGRKMSNRTRG